MTKKEQAQFTTLTTQLHLEAALRWSRDPDGSLVQIDRDLSAPNPNEEGPRYTSGWEFNTHTDTVFPAWSGPVSHGDGTVPRMHTKHGYPVSSSQGARDLYGTKLRALIALRCAVETLTARRLLAIDQMLTEAIASETRGL